MLPCEVMSVRSAWDDLDWPKFLNWTADEARTPYGKKRILAFAELAAFAQSIERARELQAETQEVSALLEKSALWGPLNGLVEIDDALETLEKGGVLEPASLARIRSWLYVFDSWSHFPTESAGRLFREALTSLLDPHECLRILDRVLTPSGELSEKASPTLATLHTQAREVRREIGIRMESLLRDYSQKGLLQERFSDVRDGRYVLPVRVSDQSKVEGRVTELSVSKQTVFIEPKEVEQLQARLRRLEADIAQEMFAILLEVSRQIRPFSDAIGASVIRVGYWDAVQARARIAKIYGGKTLSLGTDREWVLQDTANPVFTIRSKYGRKNSASQVDGPLGAVCKDRVFLPGDRKTHRSLLRFIFHRPWRSAVHRGSYFLLFRTCAQDETHPRGARAKVPDPDRRDELRH